MNLFDPKYEPENYNQAKPKERSDDLALDYNIQRNNYDGYKCYGLTFKYMNKDNPTQEDYKGIIKKVQRRAELFNYVYEDKSKNGSSCKGHIHGIAYFKHIPRFSAFSEYGLHTRFEIVYNLDRWMKYIMKNT